MNLVHWRHYLALEREFLEISQYIEICEENFNVHSVKFSHLLMASASEFEIVGCMIRNKLGVNGSGIKSILNTIEAIKDIGLKATEIQIPLHHIKLKPLEGWSLEKSPTWWTSYNKVKHERATHFKEANLYNSLMSVSALLVILAKYYHLEKMDEMKNQQIPISSALSDLNGSLHMFQLPDAWQYDW